MKFTTEALLSPRSFTSFPPMYAVIFAVFSDLVNHSLFFISKKLFYQLCHRSFIEYRLAEIWLIQFLINHWLLPTFALFHGRFPVVNAYLMTLVFVQWKKHFTRPLKVNEVKGWNSDHGEAREAIFWRDREKLVGKVGKVGNSAISLKWLLGSRLVKRNWCVRGGFTRGFRAEMDGTGHTSFFPE